MAALTIYQLTPANDLNEVDALEQESINGGFFFNLSNSGGTKLERKTILQAVFNGGNPTDLKNQVVATGNATVIIDSTVPLPG